MTPIISTDEHSSAFNGYVVPISFVADYYFFSMKGSETIPYIHNMLDLVNQIYYNSSIHIYFELANIMIFDDQTTNDNTFDYTDTGDGYDVMKLLDSFSTYADGNSTIDASEEVQLLSGVDFESTVAGLAWLGNIDALTKDTATYPRSIIQATFSNDLATATLSAHEIGHNYAATHDGVEDNTCSSTDFVMSTTIQISEPPTTFSSCSVSEISAFLDKFYGDFVDNTNPTVTDILDIGVQKEISGNYTLTWIVNDEHIGYYDLFVNDITIKSFERISGSSIEYTFSVNEIDTLDIFLNVTDLVGHHSVDYVTITIEGDLTPQIQTSGDYTIEQGYDLSLVWNITDNGNSSHIDLFRNTTLIDSINFTKSISYIHEIGNLSIGVYNYTVLVFDELNQTSTSTIIVTITEPASQDSPSEDTDSDPLSTTKQTTSTRTLVEIVTSSSSEPLIDSLIGTLSYGYITVLLILAIPLLKRKVQN